MLNKISHYELGANVASTKGLREFTFEEYSSFASAGSPRTLSEEKFYVGDDVEFNGNTWLVTIGANMDLIYNISLQIINFRPIDLDSIFKKSLDYLIKSEGKYSGHYAFSKKYIWDRKDGTIILNQFKKMGYKGINLIITSSSIRDEVAKSLGV